MKLTIHSIEETVKSIFDEIPAVRLTGIRAVDVRNQSEISVGEDVRSCRAIVVSSDADEHSVSYSIKDAGDEYFVEVLIGP